MTPIFRNLAPEQCRVLAGLGEEVEFGEGRYLMIEGQPADWFFVIRDGFVALQTDAPSGPITIETLHNGDPVGLVVAIRALSRSLRRACAWHHPRHPVRRRDAAPALC